VGAKLLDSPGNRRRKPRVAGRVTEAKRALARLLELDPTARIANVKEWAPLRRHEDLETLETGLRLASLPEY